MNQKTNESARKYFTNLFLPFAFLLFTCLSQAQTLAPGAPGKDAQWATAGKQGVGTSANLESKVWFTLAQGVMTEVYYPDVTVANVHILQFVVVNPKTKKVETEQTDAVHQIKVLRPDSLSFQQINTAKSGEWKITKTYTTDTERDSVLIDVKFEPKNKNLNLYIYYDPSLGNSGMGDSAYKMSWNTGFVAEDKKYASSLIISSPLSEMTNGFYKKNDGFEQLKEFGKIQNQYMKAENGNVVQMAKVLQPQKFTVVLSFSNNSDKSFKNATISEKKGFRKCLEEYEKGWADYIKTLRKVEPKYQAQFNMAAMQLKAHEDKTVRGANIASLSVPWGGGANANENNIGGYHLIWSRDLYQVFTAYMALGDKAAAERALDFLFKVQQKPDGSFPQNSYLDGKPFWGSLQMDEVAYPLIMAWELKRFDKATWENHVKRAADFIVKNGPATPQERWEEEAGYSPSTIAAEIAGLVCAAEIAKANNDTESARTYLKTADEWAANVEKWTVTTTGKHSKEPYYIRIAQNGKPDAGEKIELNNGAGLFDEREIVDAGFLELVRLGIKSPDDPIIQNSVKVIDEVIRVNTPNGEGFYRYNNDGYGEMDDGRRWNFDGKYTGKGRLWALLSGERGQYELALANRLKEKHTAELKTKFDITEQDDRPILRSMGLSQNADKRLESMSKFANEGLMIPEQIWDKQEVPKNIDKQFIPELKFGEGTGSATPLAWSMAQFIRLAVNLQEGENLDTPQVVYDRYVLGKKSEISELNEDEEPFCTLGETKLGNPIKKEDIKSLPPNNSHLNLLSVKKSKDDLSTEVKLDLENSCFWKWSISNSSDFKGTLDFIKKSENPHLISCQPEKYTAILFFKGEAKEVEIVGDFTDWKRKGLKLNQFTTSNIDKDLKFISLENLFAPTARVEYKLIVDGKWITDPANPNKIDNGVGGENSFFAMPDYKPTVWDKSEHDREEFLTMHGFRSEVLNGVRLVSVYVPTECVKNICPTLYMQDGGEYVQKTKAVQIQKNLVKGGKVKPFIMVFINPRDRIKEYFANDDYAKFVAEEVVPAIDKEYKTIKSRDGRAIMGASLGGITSFHTALKYPEIFSKIGGQSSSFWVDNERVVKELEKLDASKNKFTFYIDDGTLEGVEDSRKVVKILKDKGFEVTYVEGEAGHNWTAWRDRLADAFMAIWK